MEGEQQLKSVACERYVKFLLQSYLRWNQLSDLSDVSCQVRFHKPTIVRGESFYPMDFIDLLRNQLLTSIETEYGSSAAGWQPRVSFKVLDEESAMSLNIWFSALTRKKEGNRAY